MTTEARSALTEHLTAASAGPNPPPVDRLRAAAEYVIEPSAQQQAKTPGVSEVSPPKTPTSGC